VGLAACATPHSADELKTEAGFKRSFQSEQPYETVYERVAVPAERCIDYRHRSTGNKVALYVLAGPLAANTNLPVVESHLDKEKRLGTVTVKITERLFSDDVYSLHVEIVGQDPGTEVTAYSAAVLGNESGFELIRSWAEGNQECSRP
jgi:hypothetical protein